MSTATPDERAIRKNANRERYERQFSRRFAARHGYTLNEARVARDGDGHYCDCGYGCPPFNGCRHD